ncbi:MAG: Jag N-terminal domain-containing protein [Oscillospiraceae bacterium]
MMLKTLEKSGKTEEAAIAAALEELGLDRDAVSVEIVERAKSGFLGIGASPAVVRVQYEAPDEGLRPLPKLRLPRRSSPLPLLPRPQRQRTSRRAMRVFVRSSAVCSSTWAFRRRSRSPRVRMAA